MNKSIGASIILLLFLLSGCANTPPTKIGADTYYSAKTNAAGVFGNPATDAGDLMGDGNKFCAQQGKEFELVTQQISQPFPGHLGGAAITFRCVVHASNPVMRPDNGITTIQPQ